MNPWNSFLQTVFQFVKSLFTGVTKKMHRNAAILTMGATLIAVIPFTAVDFQGRRQKRDRSVCRDAGRFG